jgi:hypothetical protein
MDAQTQKRLCNDGFLTLSFAEQFLVWGARVWLAATAQGARVPTVLQEGLCAAGVPEAWEPLNGLLRILCRNMRRTPDFHGVRCLCLGRDERALVAAVSAAQRGDAVSLRHALGTLLPAGAVPCATARVEELGHLFLCAGLRFDRPNRRTSQPRPAGAPTPYYVPASRSIH